MAVYRVEFAKAASRALKRLEERARRRILAAIAALAEQPRPPGAEMLSTSEGLFRIRIGDYRVIYAIEDDHLLVLVVLVGHRREIYRRLAHGVPMLESGATAWGRGGTGRRSGLKIRSRPSRAVASGAVKY